MEQSNRIEAAGENIVLRANSCSVILMPQLGGKIASIRANDRELLQAPLLPYAPRTSTMAFDSGDASGWDECLPSVAGCTVETASGPVAIPDHGDLWRVAWSVVRDQGPGSASASSVTFIGECFSLPLRLERKATLTEADEGWRLSLNYRLTNTGDFSVPWSWAAHPLFAIETGDRIILPDSIHSLRLEGSGGGRLGTGGATVSWPIATLANGNKTDLSLAEPPASRIGDKLFAGPLSETDNWCVLERLSAGVRIRLRFDSTATPYLGLWICYGGWPEKPGTKQVCVALEPSTAPVDSLALSGQWSRLLGPGESYSWPMIVEIESVAR